MSRLKRHALNPLVLIALFEERESERERERERNQGGSVQGHLHQSFR